MVYTIARSPQMCSSTEPHKCPAQIQGNRISKEGEEAFEEVVIPTCSFELSSQRAFGADLLHGVDGHVSKHGEIVGSVAKPGSVLVLVHHHVEPPVQAVLHLPVLACDAVQPLGR